MVFESHRSHTADAEFLSIFREQRHAKASAAAKLDHQQSIAADDNEDLVGIDAKIPGGLYDSVKLSAGTEAELLK